MLSRLKRLSHSARTHQGFRRYFANTSWMFAEQILRMVAGLLVGIWVARYLGPEQFGLFSYAMAFAALFSSLAKLGLDSIMVRDLVREPAQRNVYMGTAFWLKLIGAVSMLGVIGSAMQLTSSDSTTKLYIFIIASGAIFQSFEVVDFYFQSKVLSKFVSLCKLTQLFISSLIKLYLIYMGSGLFWFVMVSLVDQITLAATLYLAYRHQKIGGFLGCFDRQVAKRLLRDSWPLIFMSLAITIYMRIDQIMIKEMLGAEKLGIYTAAVRLSEIWYFIPMIITSSIFPSIINAKNINKKLYHRRLQTLCTLMTWLAIIIALPMTLLADSVVNMFYGHQYREAGLVLAIHIWGSVFVFLGIASGVFFTAENYTKKPLFRTILGAFANVLLNLLFIPRYGIIGVALATILSQFFANFLFDFFDISVRNLLAIKAKALFPIYVFFGKGSI